jgi:hypothetical protein
MSTLERLRGAVQIIADIAEPGSPRERLVRSDMRGDDLRKLLELVEAGADHEDAVVDVSVPMDELINTNNRFVKALSAITEEP